MSPGGPASFSDPACPPSRSLPSCITCVSVLVLPLFSWVTLGKYLPPLSLRENHITHSVGRVSEIVTVKCSARSSRLRT